MGDSLRLSFLRGWSSPSPPLTCNFSQAPRPHRPGSCFTTNSFPPQAPTSRLSGAKESRFSPLQTAWGQGVNVSLRRANPLQCPHMVGPRQPMMMWKAGAQACPSLIHPALYISPFSNRDASQMPCGIYFCFWCFVGFLILAALRLPHGMRDRSSLTRDKAYIPYIGKWILYFPGLPRKSPHVAFGISKSQALV